MVRGLYTGVSGMLSQWHNMNVVANNLANINTTAFKRDEAMFKAFPEMLIRRLDDNGVVKVPTGSYDIAPYVGKLGTGVELNEIHTRFEQGSIRQTGNDFDLALAGKGFFVVKTDHGERYTRDGSFLIDKDGYLVSKDGFKVQGYAVQNGILQKEPVDIRVKTNNFKVNEYGEVVENKQFPREDLGLFVDKDGNDWKEADTVYRLKVVDFYNERVLQKEGNSFYRATKYSGEAEEKEIGEGRPQVHQGFIEVSNVNPVVEMTKMIEVQRSYEASQKVVMTQDQLLQKAVNELPKA